MHGKLAILGTVALAMAGPAFSRELIYSSFIVGTHPLNAVVIPETVERVNTESETQFTVQVAAGGALSGPNEVLATLQSGAVDAGTMIYAYTPTELPALSFVGSLYSPETLAAGAALTETIMLGCPACSAEEEEQGIKVLMNSASSNYILKCGKSPVVSLEDLRGKKVRASGGMATVMADLGAVPTMVNYAEIYQALQTGTIDCVAGAPTELRDSQLWEVASSVTLTSLGTYNPYGIFVISRETWNSFSPKDKRAWLNASAYGLARDLTIATNNASEAIALSQSEHGLDVLEPDETLSTAIADYHLAARQGVIDTATERGVADAEAIADYFDGALARWTEIVASIGAPNTSWNDEQLAAFADKIRETIFDKVEIDG